MREHSVTYTRVDGVIEIRLKKSNFPVASTSSCNLTPSEKKSLRDWIDGGSSA